MLCGISRRVAVTGSEVFAGGPSARWPLDARANCQQFCRLRAVGASPPSTVRSWQRDRRVGVVSGRRFLGCFRLRAQPVNATPSILTDKGLKPMAFLRLDYATIRDRTSTSEQAQETALLAISTDVTSTCCCVSQTWHVLRRPVESAARSGHPPRLLNHLVGAQK